PVLPGPGVGGTSEVVRIPVHGQVGLIPFGELDGVVTAVVPVSINAGGLVVHTGGHISRNGSRS
ncbi:50S ribosomal protein L28, partial [Dysosmobacter welbionis]